MSVAGLVTQGIGPGGTVPFLLTGGLGIGEAAPVAVTATTGGGGWRSTHSRRRKFLINGEVVEAFDDEIALIYAAFGLLELEEQRARPKKKNRPKKIIPVPYRPGELLGDPPATDTPLLAEAIYWAEAKLKATRAGLIQLAEIEAERAQRLLEEEDEWFLLAA